MFAYLSRAFREEGYDQISLALLDETVENLSCRPQPPSLYAGFSGVAWLVEHLQGWLFEPDDQDPGEEVSSTLQQCLAQSPWVKDYDLINGLVGFGVYALERMPRAGGEECLKSVIHRLNENAESQSGRCTWLTPPGLIPSQMRDEFPTGYYNLGVAHGIPGIIAFLGRTYDVGIAENSSERLLRGAISWLLAQKLPEGNKSVFPDTIAEGAAASPTRLSWCYGDLGLSVALLSAARYLGEPVWEQEALTIAKRAAERSQGEIGIVDAGLCHGTAGVAHLFNRLFQATGDPSFRDAACFWYQRTFDMKKVGTGIAGYLAWGTDPDGKVGWRSDPGFLTGASGIALSLLSAIAPIDPEWDRLLLASIPSLGSASKSCY